MVRQVKATSDYADQPARKTTNHTFVRKIQTPQVFHLASGKTYKANKRTSNFTSPFEF